jgi:integrase
VQSRRLGYKRSLRTTCGTPVHHSPVSAGVNVLALARMLGHKDPSVTLRVYADLFDTDLDVVAATLHARYGGDSGEISESWTPSKSSAPR